ncbi:NifB/NifX family molybdenum-iron cluster-binding protein [Caldanaerobius polysaccharolyticus]|uniref:NifB/NifX family molybdenum-iron cluster-binding protein n=1 Tax=Caldanaerobius polysaccharolyticus TaxID=44256 RepID=UPI00047BEC7F|nr:NifB/NifX family molybdenum-iron cluster-binding protein [Caldanaerobius polysaccharolyticus]
MVHRIAVATSDGKMVNEHFGHARHFLIIDIYQDGNYEVVGIRDCIPACGFGDDGKDRMETVISAISDCNAVMVSRIGFSSMDRLRKRGILPLVMPGYIKDAIEAFFNDFVAKR